MPRTKRLSDRHPAWLIWLMLASDAPTTGLSEADARAEIQRLFPSLAPELDSALANLGDLDAMGSRESALEHALRLDDEDRAAERAQGGGGSFAPSGQSGTGNGGDFTAQLRRELTAKRQTATREVGP